MYWPPIYNTVVGFVSLIGWDTLIGKISNILVDLVVQIIENVGAIV